jgi:hypothetical protein
MLKNLASKMGSAGGPPNKAVASLIIGGGLLIGGVSCCRLFSRSYLPHLHVAISASAISYQSLPSAPPRR